MYDLVIVGAGPAGLAASAYAIRKNLEFLTVADTLGGKASERVEIPITSEHRVIRPDELLADFRRELEYLRDRYLAGTVAAISRHDGGYSLSIETGGEPVRTESRSVLMATGARARRLGVPGERELAGRALGYSAVSYSHLLAGRTVFLYGDGRRGVDAALEVALHAQSVVLTLAPAAEGREHDRERLGEAKNITVLEGHTVESFHGDRYCRSVTLKSRTGETARVDADAFFLELRPMPNSGLAAGLAQLDEDGHIVVDTRNRTSADGLFAAGDVTSVGLEQSLVAIGEGVKALLSAYAQLTAAP